MKIFWNFIKRSIDVNSSISTRSICCLLGGILGAFIVFTIIFVLLFDVIKDGKIDSDITGLSVLLASNAVYVFGSSASKMFDKNNHTESDNTENTES